MNDEELKDEELDEEAEFDPSTTLDDGLVVDALLPEGVEVIEEEEISAVGFIDDEEDVLSGEDFYGDDEEEEL